MKFICFVLYNFFKTYLGFEFCKKKHLTREADCATGKLMVKLFLFIRIFINFSTIFPKAAEYAYDYLLQARDVFLTNFPKYLASIQKLQETINAAAKTVDPSYYASISTINRKIFDSFYELKMSEN